MSVDDLRNFSEGLGICKSAKQNNGKPRTRWTIVEEARRGRIASDVTQVLSMKCRVTPESLLTISMTMDDYNSDKLRAHPQSSQTQRPQQPETTMNTTSLVALDIPSSDLDLGSIIAPSKLDSPNPEQWAELDFQFRRREGS